MYSGQRLFLCVGGAALLWLVDSLLLCLSANCTLGAALFSAVPHVRLLVRLLAVVVLLFVGAAGFIAHAVRRFELTLINQADDGSLFGEEDSSSQSRRLLFYALRLATFLGLSTGQKDSLRLLCYCHDLGALFVKEEVRQISGILTPFEQKELDSHTLRGARIAAAIAPLHKVAPLIALHEELYDGSGPQARYGRSIPLVCRIFTVVRLYDYFTEIQPSDLLRSGFAAQVPLPKTLLTRAEALDEMALYRSTLLDPDVLDAFVRMMRDESLFQRVGESVFVPQV